MGPRLKLPRYVHAFTDRHGKPRYYLRRPGFKRVPLPGLPWSPTFMAAYEAGMQGEVPPVPIGASRTKPGTVSAAAIGYLSSAAFLSAEGKHARDLSRHRAALPDRARRQAHRAP